MGIQGNQGEYMGMQGIHGSTWEYRGIQGIIMSIDEVPTLPSLFYRWPSTYLSHDPSRACYCSVLFQFLVFFLFMVFTEITLSTIRAWCFALPLPTASSRHKVFENLLLGPVAPSLKIGSMCVFVVVVFRVFGVADFELLRRWLVASRQSWDADWFVRADYEHVLLREARNYGFGLPGRSVPPHVDSDKLRNELYS